MHKNSILTLSLVGGFVLVFGSFTLMNQSKETSIAEGPAPQESVEPAVEEEAADLPENGVHYEINSSESEVRFKINEVLRGNPFTVVGTTKAIEGYVDLNTFSPADTSIGSIRVDAGTLKTDDSRRDGMISRFILQATEAENRYITLQPRNVSINADTIETGQSYDMTIVGDLTVRGLTRSVEFSGEFTLTDENTLKGTATTVILYPDYDIAIPSVPFVASVDDEVVLEIDFVADNVKAAP